jgi:hypothetical protein
MSEKEEIMQKRPKGFVNEKKEKRPDVSQKF